jgi:hypothetical protein
MKTQIHSNPGLHTQADYDSFIANNINPTSRQSRDNSVQCTTCGKGTYNVAAGCNVHYLFPSNNIHTHLR